jgi:hypothetical protein
MKLIAGIDPGTTVGWAVLSLNGNVLGVGSQKEFDRDSLVAKFMSFGKIIIIGSDKFKIPSFVQETATKLGAIAVGPSQDLRIDEKRHMVDDLAFGNTHEMDALASAQVAIRKIQPLLNKIHSFLQRENHLGLFEDVVELVLKEEISIRAALAILMPKKKAVVEEKQEEQKQDEDVVRLFSALSRARKDNVVLFSKSRESEMRLRSVEKELKELKERASGLVKPKTPEEIVKTKDSQIMSLSQRLKNSLQSQNELVKLVDKMESLLLQDDKIPVLRLAHLGWEDVLKNKELIVEGSVLFVDDANQISDKAVDWLYSKGVQILICGRLPGHRARAHLPFACVHADECELLNRVALVKRVWLDKIRAERSVLAKIIEEYKKERLPDGS